MEQILFNVYEKDIEELEEKVREQRHEIANLQNNIQILKKIFFERTGQHLEELYSTYKEE